MDIFLLILGLLTLVGSGEVLVRGAAGIALKAKISPLIVGLTVVSIGTSAPELFASVTAALNGNSGLAVGNVVGSNIANLALVLGITAVIYPITVDRLLIRLDGPVMAAATLLFILFAWDMEISQGEGIILITALVVFLLTLIRRARKEPSAVDNEVEELEGFGKKGYGFLFILILIGCIGLYFGSDWFVTGASNIASSLGVSDHIIGVTVVAFGTSVPELVASAIAALRKQSDISIGNLVGSNIFNVLGVLGVTATLTPLPIDQKVIDSDMWWMLGIALLIFPMIRMGYKIVRWEGIVLIGIYIAYIATVLL
ncbi:MAG: calcium/sodium antiporter [Flavobacteriales bacterium]|nr:calcium/sodium antiporter [Flavobacteriales bacterium]